MTEPTRGASASDEISVFALAAVVLQHRWRIARWALVWGVLAVLPSLFKGRTWTARASFVPQAATTDATQSGLRSLAGQFGLVIPGGSSSSQSSDFYEQLVTSPVILGLVAADTLVVAEEQGTRRAVADLLDVRAPNPAWEREEAIRVLGEVVHTKVTTATGVLSLTVQTKWPSVSVAIAQRLLTEVNQFNLHTRQSQAAEERRFVETRVTAQQTALQDAEGRLATFLQRNRQYQNSPELVFEHDRLEREVELQQQVLVGLSQSFEEARIREVRDVPVITVLESPTLPARPDPRGLALQGLLGLVLGAFLGVLVAFAREMYARRRAEGDSDAARFAALMGDVWGGVARRLGRGRVAARSRGRP